MTQELGKTNRTSMSRPWGFIAKKKPPQQQASRSVGLWCSSLVPPALRRCM